MVSEVRKPRPHPLVVAWLRSVSDRDRYLSAVTAGELPAGVAITRRQNKAKAAEFEAWIDQVASAWSVLPMGAKIFRHWARLMHGRSDHLISDAMIAATAHVHGLVVATRNVRDFEPLGVPTLDPFAAV